MNQSARVRAIQDELNAYHLDHRGTWRETNASFWALYPEKLAQYIEASGKQSLNTLAARQELAARAGDMRENEDPSAIKQLRLFGIPPAPLSPIVEVAEGDWIRRDEATMAEHVSATTRTVERCRNATSYHKGKLTKQEAMLAALEQKDPGAGKDPIRDVVRRWNEGGTDEADATLVPSPAPAW